MRNEGPFIVEWVTWYRMLGFTDIVVVTNNCTDRSPELLDALQAAGWLHHIRCDVPEGEPITARKLREAKEHRSVRRAAWVMVCDVDEFLVVHRGAGRIGDLIDLTAAEPAFLGMSINWRVFSTGGVRHFIDAPVHQQFLRACPKEHVLSMGTKAIFRQPKRFKELAEHGPRKFEMERHGGTWGEGGLRWVTAGGQDIARWTPEGEYMRNMPRELVSYDVAQMNHYMLRSTESYTLKRATPSPVSLANRYTPRYYSRANEGKEPDHSALRYLEDFALLHAEVMSLPDVARYHFLCCADHLRLIAEKAGKPSEADPRITRFLAQAENPNIDLDAEVEPTLD